MYIHKLGVRLDIETISGDKFVRYLGIPSWKTTILHYSQEKSKKMYTILIKSDNALHAIVSVLGLSSPNVFFFLVGTTTATHYRILTIKHVE